MEEQPRALRLLSLGERTECSQIYKTQAYIPKMEEVVAVSRRF